MGFKVAWESTLGWHALTHEDVEINIVPEGGKARDTSPTLIPGPDQMGVKSGLEYASIESWMELKISSGRHRQLKVFERTSVRYMKDMSESLLNC